MADPTAVTGATGLIGRAVVAALVERGHDVGVLARAPGRAREHVPRAAAYLRFDLGGDGEWQNALADVGQVVNLAGASLFRPFTGGRYLRKVTRERIDGARRLAAALRAAPARAPTLVNASSVGVYGFGKPTDGVVDETTAPIAGEYARGSREWEAAVEEAGPDVRVVLMRLGFVLAPHGGGLKWQLDEAAKGKVSYFAPGTQWLPWVHLDDVVAFVLRALNEDEWRGAYNLMAPQQVRSREFAETLSLVTGASPPQRSAALFARMFVGAGADTMLGGRRVVPHRLTESGYQFTHPHLETALRACVDEYKASQERAR